MRYKLFGRSGLRVSELCLGTMTFGEEWGWGSSKDESKQVFDAFVETGGNFIDTANRYTEGTSEKFVGEFVGSDRERFVIATKYTLRERANDVNSSGNHRKNMVQSLEASLKRLGTDYIDLYWVHAWDYLTPVEEVMRALDDMVRAGKLLYIGVSDTPAWIVSQANTLASLRGWTPFTGLQIEYSLVERTPERELLPMAKSLDIAVTPWSILGAGILSGKYNDRNRQTLQSADARLSEKSIKLNERNLEIAAEVKTIADEIGCTPSQVAIKWLQQQPGLIIPIIGARTLKQLKDNIGCLEIQLTGEHLLRLDDVSMIDLGFPHEFLSKDNIRELVQGDRFRDIDNHRA
ncbi:MAG: aldo/keto reductase [Candidatus Zixiibacteriota bacterium]